MSYFVAIVSFALAMLLMKKWDKWRKWWLIAPLIIIGSGAFANTSLGAWLADALGGILAMPASLIDGMSASLIATALVMILAPLVVYGYVHDKKADTPEMVGTIALPLLFLVATGPLAAQGAGLFDSAAALGTNMFGGLV